MNNPGIVAATRSGYKTLSEITDFKKEIEESGLYNIVDNGNNVIYISQKEDHCIKKCTIWSHESVIDYNDKSLNESLVNESLNRISSSVSAGNRFINIYNFRLVESKKSAGIYDVYICMEKIGPVEAIPEEDVVNICMAVCSLLCRFEGVHSNINHQNIFLKGEDIIIGNPSLSGFKNEIAYYNAPEILRGDKATPSSDVYSLGIWLYHMLRTTPDNIFAARDRYGITENDIRITKKVSPDVLKVIQKAVSCEPENRYETPLELKEALEKAIKPKMKIPWKAVGITAASFLVCGALGYYIISNYDPGAKEIRTMIASGSYSLAYEEICARSSSKETDELIKEYIQGCMNVLDYQRAAQIIPEFSQEMFDTPDYLEDLFYEFRSKGKINILEPVMNRIYSKSDAIADIINRIR